MKVNDNNLLVSLQSLTTANGESPLSLPDSAGLNLSNYQINGQTVQNGTPSPATPSAILNLGYENLFNWQDLSGLYGLSNNNNGTFTITTTNIAQNNYVNISTTSLNQFLYDHRGERIVVSWDTSIAQSDQGSIVIIGPRTTGEAYFEVTGNVNSDNISFAIPKDFTSITELYIRPIRYYAGNYNGAIVSNIQLELGSVAHPYVPYGKTGIQVQSVGKNLFDIGMSVNDYEYLLTSYQNINPIFTTNSIEGTVLGSGNGAIIRRKNIAVSLNDEFVLSANYSGDNARLLVRLFDIDGNILDTGLSGYDTYNIYYKAFTKSNTNIFKFSITSSDVAYIWVGVVFYDSVLNSRQTYSNIQLELGATATAYEPYESHTYDITLSAPLRCVGSGTSQVCDYIDFANQRVVRQVGEVEFDGTEGWQSAVYTEANNRTYYLSLSHTQNTGYCSHFINGSTAYNQNQFNLTYSSQHVFIAYLDYDENNVPAFKSWLAAQHAAGTPVTVQYQLATPTYEYYGIDNIFPLAKWLTNDFDVSDGTLDSKSASGITMTSTAEDCRTVETYSYNATPAHAQTAVENFGFAVQPNTVYTYSHHQTDTNRTRPMIFYYDENYNYLSNINLYSEATNFSLTFTTPATAAYATVRLGIVYSGVTETFSNIKIQKGSSVANVEALPTVESAVGNGSLYATDGTLRSSWIKTNYWWE